MALNPATFSLALLALCAGAGAGLLRYTEEGNPYKLWIPQDSDFVRNTEWLWENFPPDLR